MKPIEFKEQSVIVAKDQPEYLPLPAYIDPNHPQGEVVFCMGLSIKERIKLLFTGKLWCALLCFHKPVTPSFFSVNKSDVISPSNERQS